MSEPLSLSEQRDIWNSLVKHQGWLWLMEILQGQVSSRTNLIVLNPLAQGDMVYEQEFKKGEISGMRLFEKIPEVQIEQIQLEIEQLKKEQENGE